MVSIRNKLLRSKTLRSDLALLAMLDENGHGWLGINAEKVFIMGFSGEGTAGTQ